MDLELQYVRQDSCKLVLDTVISHEETMEVIVPDACPDILRICDTEGCVRLKAKESQEGRVAISGSVRAMVLYLPDGAEGVRRMEADIPFSCGAEAASISAGCSAMIQPSVQAAEARLLNPRKVLIKVTLAIGVRVYAHCEEQLCTQAADPAGACVEQLTENCRMYRVISVQEKPFTFSDDVTLPGMKPEAEELLKTRVSLHCGEAKVIGSKLIFKGEAALRIFYRGTDGALCTADYALPFSQIMEVSGAGEECDCQVQVVLTELECSLEPGNENRAISVTMGLLAQAAIWEERGLQLLCDVYSTTYELSVENQTCGMEQLADRGIMSQSVREVLETGVLVKDVYDAYLTLGGVSQRREGKHLVLGAEARVTVLYTTEENALTAVSRTLPVSCQLELPELSSCISQCRCPGEVYAGAAMGGIEVRFAVDFHYVACTQQTHTAVLKACWDERAPRERDEHRPSVVLRMVGAGERMWDIAKAYGTTIQDICSANDLAGEETPVGQLMLIPCKR